ncbi:MAG: sensor histidine kinase [Crocinitomicaceae bacterium]
MLNYLSRCWEWVSYIGIDRNAEFPNDTEIIRIFFNRCLALGVFGLISQTFYSYIFIGQYGFIGFLGALSAILGLILHSKSRYAIAKRVAVYGIFISGVIVTALSGGDFLFHIGVITVFTFSWILFDSKTERLDLVLCLALTIIIYFFGELNPFDIPDFSDHPNAKTARIVGLIVYTSLVSAFIFFIRNLNNEYSAALSTVIGEKEGLLKELVEKSELLQQERNELEGVVAVRTTELQQKTEVLEEQNKEKEVLLKEVHHRVKNNLQIIVSLLNLQSSRIKDESVLRSIKEMQNRIISMSLVHQRIYQNTNFDAIDFKAYVDMLYKNSSSIIINKKNNIEYLNQTNSNLKIDIDTAIPLGLMINEMFTNSFKHAFIDEKSEYQLFIELKKDSEGGYSFIYRDSGPGLADDFTIENSDTLGMQLIDALSQQINAEITISSNNGLVIELHF